MPTPTTPFYQTPRHYSAELFIVTTSPASGEMEYIDAEGLLQAHATLAALYWDVTQALADASICEAQGFEAQAQPIYVTLH